MLSAVNVRRLDCFGCGIFFADKVRFFLFTAAPPVATIFTFPPLIERNIGVMKWFNPSSSTVQQWLDYNGTLPTLAPCQLATQGLRDLDWTNASCSRVCNDTTSLFAVQYSTPKNQNLATCGIWLTLIAAYTWIPFDNLLLPTNYSTEVDWNGFAGSSLDFGALQLAPSSVHAISKTFEEIYINLVEFSSSDDGTVAMACTVQSLFPLGGNLNSAGPSLYIQSLHDCLDAICSPVTLNPDLAGIGVNPL